MEICTKLNDPRPCEQTIQKQEQPPETTFRNDSSMEMLSAQIDKWVRLHIVSLHAGTEHIDVLSACLRSQIILEFFSPVLHVFLQSLSWPHATA